MLKVIFLLSIMTMSIVPKRSVRTVDSHKYVTVEIKKNSVAVENGKPFSVFIQLKPAYGIHLNAKPPVSVKSLTDNLKMKVEDVPIVGEWIDPARPIEIKGNVISMNSVRHEAKFVLSYTYCSEKEKWCRFGNDTISIFLKAKK